MKQETFEAKRQTTPISWIQILVCAIPILGIIYSIIANPEKELKMDQESPAVIGLFAFMLFAIIFLVVSKVKPPVASPYLIITPNGIWSRKTKLIEWNKIWYLYIEETRGKGSMTILRIKIQEPEKEIDISITNLDKTEDQLMEAIRYFSAGQQIQILHKEVFTDSFI